MENRLGELILAIRFKAMVHIYETEGVGAVPMPDRLFLLKAINNIGKNTPEDGK